MPILEQHTGLYTDHYELTMAQAYFLRSLHETSACFDYFFRLNPFGNGYAVFAGLGDLVEVLENLRFGDDDCGYLLSVGFARDFVDYLRSFRFRADVYSPQEGEVIFPLEPVVRVEGNIIDAQIIETLLLNILNFESLIATKAARIRLAAGQRPVVDFGFRRAQGPGGILAARAAVIGGVNSTSNLYSAFRFGLSSTGTQAHSFIQAHDDELTAFREFAATFPARCTLLVDTYDTLRSGIPNAITVAREMESRGERLDGVRLDSGDLAYLSKKARSMLDRAGLNYVKIVVSNKLDEHVIKSLLEQGAPVDAFGVGTKLVTGHPDGSFDGVYKLAESGGKPRLKISENPEKTLLPGRKNILRCLDDGGYFAADAIVLEDEQDASIIYHPVQPEKSSNVSGFRKELLLQKTMERGRAVLEKKSPEAIASFARSRLQQLPAEHKRFENPHVYKVGISERVRDIRSRLVSEARKKYGQ